MKQLRILSLFFALQATLYGASLSTACEHLSAACEELAGLYDEECCDAYLPVEKCCYWGELSFYADYLWWNIYQEGLNYAVSGVQNNVPSEGKLFIIDSDWDSGFRIGAGVFFPVNAWRLTFDWLHFRTDMENSVIASGLTLRSTRGEPGGLDTLDSARAEFDFKLDSLRIGLQVPLFTRTHFALKPSFAIRADIIAEDFDATYDATGSTTGFFSNSLDYWGVGPEVGLEAAWYLLPTFYLFGQANFAGLYGDHEIHQQGFTSSSGEDVNIRHQIDRMQTTLGTAIGVQWEGVFFRCIFLALSLQWETNLWFGLYHDLNFTDSTNEGNLIDSVYDLRTSGITARLGISY